jgi:hypothetical protein
LSWFVLSAKLSAILCQNPIFTNLVTPAQVFPGPKEQLRETFLTLFKNIIKGTDLTEVKAEHDKILKDLGLNNEKGEEFYDSLKTLIEAISSGKRNLKVVDDFVEMSYNYIRSQPGLEEIPEAKTLRADPKNKNFFMNLDRLTVWTETIKKEMKTSKLEPTALASKLFNFRTAVAYANFTVFLAELVTRLAQENS